MRKLHVEATGLVRIGIQQWRRGSAESREDHRLEEFSPAAAGSARRGGAGRPRTLDAAQ